LPLARAPRTDPRSPSKLYRDARYLACNSISSMVEILACALRLMRATTIV